jgi:O-antigen ligase
MLQLKLKTYRIPLMLFTLAVGLRFSCGGIAFIKPFYIATLSIILKLITIDYSTLKISYKRYLIGFPYILIIFLFYGFFTTSWSMSTIYGLSKIGLLSFWVFAFLLFSNDIVEDFYLFIKYIFVVTIIVLFIFYVVYGSPFEIIKHVTRFYRLFANENTSPMSYSKFLGIGILSSFCLFLNTKSKLIYLGTSGVTLTAFAYMILTGSKGPLFSLFISLLFFIFFILRGRTFKLSFLLIFCIVILGFSFSGSAEKYEFLFKRYISLEHSYSTRAVFLSKAINEISISMQSNLPIFLFGNGSGNFSYLFRSSDTALYPHNIIVELLYEYGLVGLILFLVSIMIPAYNSIRLLKRDESIKYLILFWIYLLLTTMTSGDISGNFLFFGFSVLIYSYLNMRYTKLPSSLVTS